MRMRLTSLRGGRGDADRESTTRRVSTLGETRVRTGNQAAGFMSEADFEADAEDGELLDFGADSG